MARPLTGELSASRLANLAAPAIAEAFIDHQDGFAEITRRARGRFERRDWHGAVADAAARLDLYGRVIDRIERDVRDALGARVADGLLWAAIKAVYSGLIAGRDDWELAETFFNSVTRRVFATVGVDPNIEFVASDFDGPPVRPEGGVVRTYRAHAAGTRGATDLVEAILRDGWFDAPFENARRDAWLVAERLATRLRDAGAGPAERAEIVRAPFFRRKGAYLVGRIVAGQTIVPLVLALLNTERGIVVDAVLLEEDDLSVLFSFTRSHFHVDVGPPHQLVRFLHRLMPNKRIAELYIAVGYHKHGKTELYRDLLRHLRESDDRFELAPGTPGMVMAVFTMPGYDVVFKIIRDRFPAIKPVTRQGIQKNYRLVFRHDRAGRLVEAQEFEHLKFDRRRFADDLLLELGRHAAQTVDVGDEDVVVHHAYVERRVIPLDVYVRTAPEESVRAIVADFGQAIKDLAATGIFPGELLPKNFGVTRHGRIVCYDYDELSLLTDFTFRRMPVATSPDEEYADEAWFGVGPRDVFPEEIPSFIGLPRGLRAVLDEQHADLYDVQFWTGMQERVRGEEIVDIFPYRASLRLPSRPGGAGG